MRFLSTIRAIARTIQAKRELEAVEKDIASLNRQMAEGECDSPGIEVWEDLYTRKHALEAELRLPGSE